MTSTGYPGHRIETAGKGRVRYAEAAAPDRPLGDDEIEGSTVVSLVSPGTESQLVRRDHPAPVGLGYAAVLRVESVGPAVRDVRPGDLRFCHGPHASAQRHPAAHTLPLPDGLDPRVAVFARMMSVTWTTLTTTAARPPARVLITGLGVVGNMAAQVFAAAGYRVTAVDPVPSRRALASAVGIRDVQERVPETDHAGLFTLALECASHEAAVLDAINATVHGGEVVLIARPWVARTDLTAQAVLHQVFERLITLRSGWEWRLPFEPALFTAGSALGNCAGALDWLADGRVSVDGLAAPADPRDAERVYRDLAGMAALTALFEWDREGSRQRA